MLGTTRALRVYLYDAPCDMRKSFDALSALVTTQMQRAVLSGDLFAFVSRDQKRSKVLYWDGTGLCVFSKRLERGRFFAAWEHERGAALQLTMNELSLFLEGMRLDGRLPLSPEEFRLGE